MSKDSQPADRPLSGIAFNLGAVGISSFQDVVLKTFSDRYPIFEFAIVRSLAAILTVSIIIVLTGRPAQFRPNRPLLIAVRGTLTFFGYTAYYLALASVPLVDAVTVFFIAPLLVTALSAPLLGEHVGIRRWSAVLAGFGGVLVMLRPGGQTMEPALLLALFAAGCYALQLLITRRIGYADSGLTLVLYNMVAFGVASSCGSLLIWWLDLPVAEHASLAFLLRDWTLPPMFDLTLMTATGVVIAAAHFCSAQAYRRAPPAVVSVFEYAHFIWALILGYVLFDELPGLHTYTGACIIIAAGIYVVRREAALARSSQ